MENEMLRIVTCKKCGNEEYYGAMYWEGGGVTVCRRCIYQSWQISDSRWSPGERDYIFPKYLDGKVYVPVGGDS